MKTTKARRKLINGNYFRSITEYSWSIFFEQCGINFLYEYQKFETSLGWYLPDFYLPVLKTYIEIKPSPPTIKESTKCYEVCQQTGATVILLSGMPAVKEFSDGAHPCNFGIWYWTKNDDLVEGVRIYTDKAFTRIFSDSKDLSLKNTVLNALSSAMKIEDRWNTTLADLVDRAIRDLSKEYSYEAQSRINADKVISETNFETNLKKVIKNLY
tara:strand:- start:2459 stop:3097 length:639 start_codon:yes stop_codon:yes gene_type:complete